MSQNKIVRSGAYAIASDIMITQRLEISQKGNALRYWEPSLQGHYQMRL